MTHQVRNPLRILCVRGAVKGDSAWTPVCDSPVEISFAQDKLLGPVQLEVEGRVRTGSWASNGHHPFGSDFILEGVDWCIGWIHSSSPSLVGKKQQGPYLSIYKYRNQSQAA